MNSASATNGRLDAPGLLPGDDIQIDLDLAALIPPLSKGELAELERRLVAEGCIDALIVWQGMNILVDGHNRLAICRRHNIPFAVNLVEFADREAAEAYIVKHQLGRRNISAEAASYLRGKRYLAEKQAHGGDHKAGSRYHGATLKTAQRLADENKVGIATVYRDARFAQAVDAIATNSGAEAKKAILSRDGGLKRRAVFRLAKMNAADQRHAMQMLLATGKLPPAAPARPATITLPAEPKSLAQKLFRRLGANASAEVFEALAAFLRADQAEQQNGAAVKP